MPSLSHSGNAAQPWAPAGHTDTRDTQGPPRLPMKHKGPLQPKGAWFSRGLFSVHFLTVYILWVILTFGCTLCPHRKVGNAILNSSSLCQSVQPDTAKECTRPTFWGFLKYPFLWQWVLQPEGEWSITDWFGIREFFSFLQLLIVSLLLVLGDKANEEQHLPLFCNIMTFKQGKWELSNRDFDIDDDDRTD